MTERTETTIEISGVVKHHLEILVRTVREALRDNAKDLAAAIAFWAFFSVFPLLIGVFSLAGYFLESAEVQSRISEVVGNLLPGSAAFVRDNLEAVVRYRGAMTWVGILGLLWTAGKGFGAISRAVNQTLEIKRPHSIVVSKFRHFLMAVAVSILIVVSIGISVVVEIILEPAFLTRLGLDPIEVPRLRSWAMTFVMAFLIFGLIYKMAPYVKVAWRQVLPGALLAAVLFELLKAAFLFYLDRIAHFEAVYGSLSSIIVLLLWLYVSALILVLGAEYNIVRAQGVDGSASDTPE
jgi:membrane protein